ncbi:MAG: cell division protein FtsA [Porphyromonadaceae bacterium CG2_30_38_12]|nr:MAG: cell division protein FtsA [Porphyromonadaceae bacterium CG2_30_38_12]
MSNKFVAIDLGSTRISAMAAEVQEDGFLKILGIESKPADDIKYGTVEQVSGAAYKINELVKLLENSARLGKVDVVSVSVGAKSMKNIFVTVSHSVGASNTVSELLVSDMLVEAERKVTGEQIAVYDVIPLWYELDGKRMDEPVGQPGNQLVGKYNVVFGNATIAENLERCFDRNGLILEYRCLAVDAISTAVLDEDEREKGCALINLGGLTSTLAIFADGALQKLVVVPLGGKHITKDIEEFGISEQNAERLKCVKGAALESAVGKPINIKVPSINPENPPELVSTQILALAIEARLDDIMNPIFDAIEAFEGSLDSGIILTGNASRLIGISDYIKERTGFKTRFGNYNDWLGENTDPKYIDISYSQLAGTILLNHEYRQEHPLEDKVKAKKKSAVDTPNKNRKLGVTATKLLFDFFEDKNKMS